MISQGQGVFVALLSVLLFVINLTIFLNAEL